MTVMSVGSLLCENNERFRRFKCLATASATVVYQAAYVTCDSFIARMASAFREERVMFGCTNLPWSMVLTRNDLFGEMVAQLICMQ